MQQIEIDFDHLLPVLDPAVENRPFSYLSQTVLYIGFEDYKRLIDVISRLQVNWLGQNAEIYKNMLDKKNEVLIKKYFYSDLCDVVLREIVLANMNGFECTSFSPDFGYQESSIELSYDSLDKLVLKPEAISSAKTYVASKYAEYCSAVYLDVLPVGAQYIKYYNYAIYLRGLAMSKSTEVKNIRLVLGGNSCEG